MEEVNKNRVVEEKNKNNLVRTAKLLINISAITIIISFFYLITRRWILVTDSTIRAFGVNGFITERAIEVTFVGFTKFFDSIQAIACFTLLIGFILTLKTNKNIKKSNDFIIAFSILVILNAIRPIIIHRGLMFGWIFGWNFVHDYYYDMAFFLWITDGLRIVIVFMLILSIYFLSDFLEKLNLLNLKLTNIAVKLLGAFLLIYIIIALIGVLYFYYVLYSGFNANIIFDIIMYYSYYVSQSMLQIGNIIAFSSFIKIGKLIIN